MAETKEDSVNVVSYEYLSESEDDDFEYEQVPESDSESDGDLFDLEAEETLASIERSVQRFKQATASPKKKKGMLEETDEGEESRLESKQGGDEKKECKTVVRPVVIDDFFRSFLLKLNMQRTLDAFNTEWYELEAKGKLNEEQIGAVPDIYLRNEELDERVKTLRVELDKMKAIAEKAQSTWDKFRKERDFHRLHHKRVVQEKNKLIGEIKRVKKHYQTYEPTIKQLRQKYELAMKEKMLMKIERDKLAARTDSLEKQLRSIDAIEDGSPNDIQASSSSSSSSSSKEKHSRALMAGSKSTVSKRKSSVKIHKKITHNASTTGDKAAGNKRLEPQLPQMDPPNPFLSQVLPAPAVNNMQLVKTFEGHVNAISAVAYHPRKQVVATASDDHTWKLWSIPNGDLIMSGEGHSGWVAGVDFHPKGTHLLSCAGDGTVKLWDFERAACTVTLTDHSQPVWDISWHYTGEFFTSCSMDHTAKLWDVETHRVRQTFRGHVDSVNSVQFQPYSSNVCTASGDKTVSLWDSRSGLCVQTLYGHNNACSSLSLNIKGDIIASCDADGIAKIWDVRMVKELFTLDAGAHALNDIAFDRSGCVLAAASDDGTVKMFDAVHGQPITQLRAHDDAVQSVVFDPASNFFVSAGSDNTFRVWKI